MTVYISGGSNSILENGWAHRLRDRLGDRQKVENISIGAAPSPMGAYRCHQLLQMKPGDTVIWEYGVNDVNHIDRRGYRARDLLKALEWTILCCRDRGAKFAAMIFQPNNREKKEKVSRYRRMVHQLCNRYGVGYFDVSTEYLASRPRATRIPRRFFQGNAHYKTDTDLIEFIVDGAVGLLESARVPEGEPSRGLGRLVVHSDFDGGDADYFENRMIAVRTWRPGDQGLSCQMEAPGRIVGVILTSTPKGGVFDVSVGSRVLRVSATFREKKFNKTLLKFISIPALAGEVLDFRPGDRVTISWADSAEGALADFRFRKRVKADAIAAREAGIVALMVEET